MKASFRRVFEGSGLLSGASFKMFVIGRLIMLLELLALDSKKFESSLLEDLTKCWLNTIH